jgi:serine/threonine-protein kinase
MPARTKIAPNDRAAFLEAVRAADLLTAPQLTRARGLAAAGSAADAARALVAAGVLTRFQAERLMTGRTDGFFLGQYAILEPIGRGPLSRVYKAKHRTMNRPVAVKVLAAELTRTADDRERIQAGVRAAGKLSHPNVVTAYDANEMHDRFYFVLEFVDGPNFDGLVRRRGPLPVAEACEYVRQAASGLQHAHEKGMPHGDIKPTNLLVARPTPAAPPAVKIADFGIPNGPAPAGSNPFAAPEARGPGAVDCRADLYSLGCVFYFLLTGRAPDPAPIPVGRLRPEVPPDVGAIVSRLMAENPAARFPSAADVLARLDAACRPSPADDVSFEMPEYPLYPGQDSGYLTGRYAQPHSGFHPAAGSGERPGSGPAAGLSPWAQLTDEVAEDTRPLAPDATPDTTTPAPKLKPPGRGGSVPWWMTAGLLVGVVLLCLMGINVAVQSLAK